MDPLRAIRHTPRWLNYTALTLFLFGVLIAATGCILDLIAGWPDRWSFIPNILTSVSSFSVGLPFAYYVVAAIVEDKQERSELSKIDRLTSDGWLAFRDAVSRVPIGILADCSYVHSQISDLHASVISLIDDSTLVSARNHELQPPLEEKAFQMEILVNELNAKRTLLSPTHWFAIKDAWSWLYNNARARRIESDLGWLPTYIHLNLAAALDGKSPWDVLIEGVTVDDCIGTPVSPVGQLPDYYRRLGVESTQDELPKNDSPGQRRPRSASVDRAVDHWSKEVANSFERWQYIGTIAQRIDPRTLTLYGSPP